jgi:hypothetical protein
MQVILNATIVFLIYLSLQVFLYRFLKINLNRFSVILFIFFVSSFIAFYIFSAEILMNLICLNLMNICFYIVMTGIINRSPALLIVDLIKNKKIIKKNKLKIFFLKTNMHNAIEKRLKTNIKSKFITYTKKGFFLTPNAKFIIIFFNFIKTIYRLKSDA